MSLDGFIKPVIDRTEEDVINLRHLLQKGYSSFTEKEKTEWSKDHKGALNVSDMNRISNNSYVLGQHLGLTQIKKTTFSQGQFLRTTDFQTIANNLKLIIDNVKSIKSEDKYLEFSIDTLPTIPNLPFNDYIKINLIENIQYIIYNIINTQQTSGGE